MQEKWEPKVGETVAYVAKSSLGSIYVYKRCKVERVTKTLIVTDTGLKFTRGLYSSNNDALEQRRTNSYSHSSAYLAPIGGRLDKEGAIAVASKLAVMAAGAVDKALGSPHEYDKATLVALCAKACERFAKLSELIEDQ